MRPFQPSARAAHVIQARGIVSARIIDGKAVARQVEQEVAAELARVPWRPGLVAIRVGDDPASAIYVRNKARKAEELGFRSEQRLFPQSLSETDLLSEIHSLNQAGEVDGILVQLPLPGHIDARMIIDAVDPGKDVDGFHPINVGRLHLGRPTLAPCTPSGVMKLIDSTGQKIEGRHAVVVGRSDIVGKPQAALFLQRSATVTICHSRTEDLASVVREGHIVVAAVGKPFLITADMIRPGAIVIDVGMNRVEPSFAARLQHDRDKLGLLVKNGSVLVGDVDFQPVRERAGWITPVPGGVGPMTIAMLMRNTLTAAHWRRR